MDVAGLEVVAFPTQGLPAGLSYRSATELSGRFELSVPSGGTYNLVAMVPGKRYGAIRWNVQAATIVDLDLVPTSSIKGRVAVDDQTELAGIDVFVPGTGFFGTTDSAGSYQLGPLPFGAYQVVARGKLWAPGRLDDIQVGPGGTTTAPLLRLLPLPASGGLVGRVQLVDASGSAGIRVVFAAGKDSPKATMTTAEGAFSLDGLPAGSGKLIFSLSGYQDVSIDAIVYPDQRYPVGEVRLWPRYVVTTLVGPDLGYPETSALTVPANYYVLDGVGNLYASTGGPAVPESQIVKVNLATGQAVPIAGSVTGFADGVGTGARFGWPQGLALDGKGNVFVADFQNGLIRKLALATGVVSTVAGSDSAKVTSDGVGDAARFNTPEGLVYDGTGSLYVSEAFGHVIRRVDVETRSVTTIAGSTGVSGKIDGLGAVARFHTPRGLHYDPSGNLYVVDTGSRVIRKISLASGLVATVAGSGADLGPRGIKSSSDGLGTAATFQCPWGITGDGTGSLYVSDCFVVRRIDVANFNVNTVNVPVSPLALELTAVAYDPSGKLFVSDSLTLSPLIRVMDLNSLAPSLLLKSAPARLSVPAALALDAAGNLYVGDNVPTAIINRVPAPSVRKIAPGTRATSRVAGGIVTGIADGPLTGSQFTQFVALDFDASGSLFAVDSHYLRRIDIAKGVVTTQAGTDGNPLFLAGISGVAVDNKGIAYISNQTENVVRVVDTVTGAIRDLVGTNKVKGDRDEQGLLARFNGPRGLALDSQAGILYVADTLNHRVRQIELATRRVSTLAGGVRGTRDGMSRAAEFDSPISLALDRVGGLYVSESGGQVIRRINLETRQVTKIAGMARGFADGPGSTSALDGPAALAVDSLGSLYVADTGNSRIRLIARR